MKSAAWQLSPSSLEEYKHFFVTSYTKVNLSQVHHALDDGNFLLQNWE